METNQKNSEQLNQQETLKQLDVFVGKWHAEGKSYADGQQRIIRMHQPYHG